MPVLPVGFDLHACPAERSGYRDNFRFFARMENMTGSPGTRCEEKGRDGGPKTRPVVFRGHRGRKLTRTRLGLSFFGCAVETFCLGIDLCVAKNMVALVRNDALALAFLFSCSVSMLGGRSEHRLGHGNISSWFCCSGGMSWQDRVRVSL